MTIPFDPFMNPSAHTFREIALNEGNSLWTDLLTTSLFLKEKNCKQPKFRQ